MMLAEQELEIKASTAEDISALKPQKTTAKLNKALYGTEAKTDDAFKFGTGGSDDRAKLCSKTGGPGTRTPGYSLIHDASCLCASAGGSDGANGKACCDKCARTGGDQQLTVNTKAEDHWAPLQTACKKLAPQTELSTAAVAAAATALTAQLKHKTATQTNHVNVLGKLDGTGETGRGGNSNSNEGKCVVCVHGLQTTGPNAVPWLQALVEIASNEAARRQALNRITNKIQQLNMINTTIMGLLHSPRVPLSAQQTSQSREVQQKSAKETKRSVKNTKTTKLHAKVQINANGMQKMENLKQKENSNPKRKKNRQTQKKQEKRKTGQLQLDVQDTEPIKPLVKMKKQTANEIAHLAKVKKRSMIKKSTEMLAFSSIRNWL
uniref:Variant surface glycoprotein n=1 Tax=Trypanosoma brucei TaxID=5691 RepID=A0A1V0FYC8_9TRYP|nr:variant surface glycoprotein [Trypanosoma brucei]